MPTPSILAELPKYTRDAVRFYWQTRAQQLGSNGKPVVQTKDRVAPSPAAHKWMASSNC